MLDPFPLKRPALPVERFGVFIHKQLHNEGIILRQSISRKSCKHLSIYGGTRKMKITRVEQLFHTECQLSTENRDLSTETHLDINIMENIFP